MAFWSKRTPASSNLQADINQELIHGWSAESFSLLKRKAGFYVDVIEISKIFVWPQKECGGGAVDCWSVSGMVRYSRSPSLISVEFKSRDDIYEGCAIGYVQLDTISLSDHTAPHIEIVLSETVFSGLIQALTSPAQNVEARQCLRVHCIDLNEWKFEAFKRSKLHSDGSWSSQLPIEKIYAWSVWNYQNSRDLQERLDQRFDQPL